jgi:hypothetical protein
LIDSAYFFINNWQYPLQPFSLIFFDILIHIYSE